MSELRYADMVESGLQYLSEEYLKTLLLCELYLQTGCEKEFTQTYEEKAFQGRHIDWLIESLYGIKA